MTNTSILPYNLPPEITAAIADHSRALINGCRAKAHLVAALARH